MAEDNMIRPGRLTDEHAGFLAGQAVDVDMARSLGVRSLVDRDDTKDLGDSWENWANFPAIMFPWVSPDGGIEYQVRPDNPTKDSKGKLRKYVFRRSAPPILWNVRPVSDPETVLIVEGTKQCLAAASYAEPGVAVYGIAGCRMWQTKENGAIPDLYVADGRDVVVVLDSDAATNPDVYRAGMELGEALKMEGAKSVRFSHLPGASGKSGLDDILSSKPADRRASYLTRAIRSAKPKPADKRPAAKPSGQDPPQEEGRVTVICNGDRFHAINDLTNALVNKWDGRELFNHGGVISRLRRGRMTPVDRGTFHDVVQETAITVNESSGAQGSAYVHAWPDPGTMAATMSRAERFCGLDGIAQAPFVRPDGTVCTEPGYDAATRTILVSGPGMEGVQIPDDPSPEQVAAARDLIMTEWLGDFPFSSDADRANALALVVTPAVRSLISRVPLAVVDGLQMGVGKNKLADSIHTVYTGEPSKPMNFVDEHEELRKQITSAFRTGAEFFVFDEAHTIQGAALAQALTADTWQDRILGVSTMANFPNRVTWISLGNQVQVRGDIARRVYRIALRPDYENPQDRPASSFRHPGQSGLDLEEWTRQNRKNLVTAILTVVRAWFSRGCPPPSRGVSFGSFESWERIVGGVVETAGLTGFLGNLKAWRSETDFDTQYWIGHLMWLSDQFGSKPFRTSDVKAKALTNPADYPAPPKLDDPTDRGYGKALGEAYSRLNGRRYDGMWIEREGNASGHVSKWRIRQTDAGLGPEGPPPADTEPDPEGPPPTDTEPDPAPESEPDPAPESEPDPEGPPPAGTSERVEEVRPGPGSTVDLTDNDGDTARSESSQGAQAGEPDVDPVGTVAFDLETGEASNLYRRGPGFVRLIGWAVGDELVQIRDDPDGVTDLVSDVAEAAIAVGHNIMAFDIPALVREGAITMPVVHRWATEGRLFDTLLAARHLDPPMARDKGVDATRKYDLDSLGEKYGIGSKVPEVKDLVKTYGWDGIPTSPEDPDPQRARDAQTFCGYLCQDVNLSRNLYRRIVEEFGGSTPKYLIREHRVAAIATQISVNGFLADRDALDAHVRDIESRKAKAMQLLAGKYGIPTHDAKGRQYKSPLSTKVGKAALERVLTEAGVDSIWRTGTTREIEVGAGHMVRLYHDYHHIRAAREVAQAVYAIVSARTVYQTARDNLCPDGRVHPRVSFSQATGRWSLTEPGLTVFGKRGGRHVERMVFLPDPGEVIIAADLSQVDMRAVAGLSQDQAYIDMLHHDDPHAEIAKALFGDVRRREQAKAIGHGWNYGRGIEAISTREDISPELVVQFDRSMRQRFGRLVAWQNEVRAVAESGHLLDNGFGRPMRADPRRAHTQGPALMGQGAARDIMMTGLLNLATRYPEVLPMLRAQVHDEIVLSVPADQAEDIGRAVVQCLSFEWRGVPITADVSKPGQTWGHVYEKG